MQFFGDKSMMPWRSLAQLMLALLLMPTVAAAQPLAQGMAGASAPHIRAEFIAESDRPAPGRTIDVAISMIPEPTWHGYWLNGGDAGFGMQVTWSLPPGVAIGKLAYPTPETLVIAGLMNHVYERPYALIAPLTVDPNVAPGTRLPIRGEANWLACTDQVCVPERGAFTLTLIAGDGAVSAERQAQFDLWRATIPQPLNGPARYEVVDGKLRLSVPLPGSLQISAPHLFIEEPRINKPGAAQAFSRNGDHVIIVTEAGPDLAPGSDFHGLIRIADGRGLAFVAKAGEVGPAGEPLGSVPAAGTGLWPQSAGDRGASIDAAATGFSLTLFVTALIGSIVGGLILNIMPCVFPILSLKALALARAGGEERHVRREGFAYTAGAVLTCIILGTILLLLRAGGEAAGWAFQLQRPESVVLLTVLMAAITANLAGLFSFGSLSFNLGRASRTDHVAEENPTKNAFLTGALAAFVATPCSGPLLGAALGATLVLPGWASLLIFGGLGLGLALPFLLLALVPGLRTRLPKPGPWMETMRRWLAVPMALTALALVWLLGRQVGQTGWLVGGLAIGLTLASGWWAGRMQAKGTMASPAFLAMAASIVPLSLLLPLPPTTASDETATGVIGGQSWSESRLQQALASNKPVFVYFTADWCVSCKVNEASSIEREETTEAFRAAGVTVLKADWTNADQSITRELAKHGRNSVPLYLWYRPGQPSPEILPQILTPAMLVDRARAVN
ncbi:protein-disulfide reductase DsbD family protein [Sphingomonas lacunae]